MSCFFPVLHQLAFSSGNIFFKENGEGVLKRFRIHRVYFNASDCSGEFDSVVAFILRRLFGTRLLRAAVLRLIERCGGTDVRILPA